MAQSINSALFPLSPHLLFSAIIPGQCFSVEERPLIKLVQPASFDPRELTCVPYDLETDAITFTDMEPDDFSHLWITLSASKAENLFVTEPHHKLGNTYLKARTFIDKIRRQRTSEQLAFPGGADVQTVACLLTWLKTKQDKSIVFRIIAPCPTLAALIEADPKLVADKVKRIVSWGGLTQADTPDGGQAYYTSFNLTKNLNASRCLFHFAETYRIPFYILGGKRLKLERKINFDFPLKLRQIPTEATQQIIEETTAWNHRSLDGKKRRIEKLEKTAAELGYGPQDIYNSMTPSDPLVAMFDFAFPCLEIQSTKISNIQITDEPRYEKNEKTGEWEPKDHRKVLFRENDPDSFSQIFSVDGFSFRGWNTTNTSEILLNHLLNISWHNQL